MTAESFEVDAGGTTLRGAREGEGPPIVLAHGLTAHRDLVVHVLARDGGTDTISACSAMICDSPPEANSSNTSSSPREKAAPSAVPCTSTNKGSPPSLLSITTFMSTSAVESSTYGRSSTGNPPTMPTLIAAQYECSGCVLMAWFWTNRASASCSAR